MRISTSMIFQNSVTSMQNQTSAIMNTQQQISSGSRMTSPSDDPAAAAEALQVTQSKELNSQYASNQSSATSTLNLADGQLDSVGNLVQYVRDRIVQASTATLNDSDRKAIATDLKSQFAELVGLANGQDGLGQYLFSGNNGGTQPFTAAIAPPGSTVVTYNGDDGQRALQVSNSRQMPVNDAGSKVFMGTPFVQATAAGSNSGYLSVSAASATDPGALTGHAYQISLDYTKATYQVTDSTLSAPNNVVASGAFTAGAPPTPPTQLNFDGASITLAPAAAPAVQPASGTDTFSVGTGTPSIFDTLSDAINALQTSVQGNSTAAVAQQKQLGTALANLDASQNSILNTRASIGSRLNELSALGTQNSSLNIQYVQILSSLQDTDYTKAISQLSQQQIGLQAAQKSFVQISNLSLFNYIQ